MKVLRVLASLLAATLLAASAAQASTAYITERTRAYQYPDTQARSISVTPGVEVDLIDVRGKWAKVRRDGMTAYVDSSLVLTEQGAGGVTVYAARALTLRSGPAQDAQMLASVSEGQKMTLHVTAGEWSGVTFDGHRGFVRSAGLTYQASRPQESTIIVAYARYDGVPVYQSDSTGSAVLGTLDCNEAVDVCAKNDTWCRVRKGENIAYVKKADLSPKPEGAARAVYVQRDGAQVYSADSKSSTVLAKLSVNTPLSVLAQRGSWARVTNGRGQGYMPLSDLGVSRAPESEPEHSYVTGYVKNPGARLYASPSDSAQSLATFAFNATVEVGEIRGEWGKVRASSATGYMRMEDLSSSRVETITAYARDGGASVYASTSRSAAVIGTLSVNEAVTLAGTRDGWGRAVNGEKVGYILLEQLSREMTDTTLRPGDKGEAVREVQSRLKELGYFAGTLGGNYLTLTQSAVEAFQRAAKLPVNGVVDQATRNALFASDAPKYSASNAGYSNAEPATGTAREMDWWTSGIQSIFARGTVAKVTDVETGISWYEKRTGGTNHADVQPLTAADSNSMKRAYGGKWSWDRRAIFVTIDGVNYAASMNGMPHGSGSISGNNFDGHHCIHFTNSRTHGTNRRCPDHQAAIQKALRATL